MSVNAPYNFVPAADNVVTPWWAAHISHDVPFEDAQSGEIKIRLTAHSPIFVRDGAPKNSGAPVSDFSSFDNRCFIPGSSLKGMLRNVLEIISFSRMDNKLDNHRYAVRDLQNKDLYRDHFNTAIVFAGWLKKNADDSWTIRDCGLPGRISHKALDELLPNFSAIFRVGGAYRKNDDDHKSARYKYEKFEGIPLTKRFHSEGKDNGGRDIYTLSDDPADKRGTIVFTGQPSQRTFKTVVEDGEEKTKGIGKHMEFIFFEPGSSLPVSPQIVQDFYFAYFDHDENRWSKDWRYWRKELEQGREIPVFFQKNDKGQVKHLGLSYLYKLPYTKSVRDAVPHQAHDGIDLSEAIFGYIKGDREEEGLKGRVQFAHAFLKSGTPGEPRHEVLSSPKASYYPTYVRQEKQKNGKVIEHHTFMDTTATVAGWKRYPVRPRGDVATNQGTDSTSTTFVPLQAGAVFESVIRYHNLKRVELGALLSALTFHNAPGAFHSLGMAKPLGYGKVKIELPDIGNRLMEYLKAFEAFMEAYLNRQWLCSPQMKELRSMALEPEALTGASLQYMQVGVGGGNNEFAKAKGAKLALPDYSDLPGVKTISLHPLASEADIIAAEEERQRGRQIFAVPPDLAHRMELFRHEQGRAFEKALAERKQALHEALRERRELLRQQQAEIKLTGGKEMLETGKPAWDSVVAARRPDFGELKKAVERFVKECYREDYKTLCVKMPEGVLPVRLQEELKQVIRTLYDKLPPKEQAKWITKWEQNHNMRKVGEWVGEAAARELLAGLTA